MQQLLGKKFMVVDEHTESQNVLGLQHGGVAGI